ncbi:MAG: AI-2E family transporter [Bacteroidales bacterium]|nr:AI-2E family transporter [Bacteroidales bacterium]
MENKSLLTKQISPALNTAAFIIIIAGMMYASSLISLMLLSLFISIVVAQPLGWLTKKKVPHGLAILIVLLGVLLIFFIIGQLIGGSVAQFTNDAPKYTVRLNEIVASTFQSLNDIGFNVSTEQLREMFDAGKIMSATAGMLGELSGLMGNTVVIIFIVVFLLLELNVFAVKTIAIVDKPGESLKYLNEIGHSIRHYLGIKTLVSLLTGFLIWIGMLIIGVEYAILWAMIAFLLNYIPNIGSIIAGVPAILFALVQLGFDGFLWTMGVFVFVNMFVGSVVEPRVMGKGLGLSTLVVFLSLIFWGFILGTVGMFLSVPLTMTVKIILEQNEKTKWIAILLGTRKEAEVLIERRKYN